MDRDVHPLAHLHNVQPVAGPVISPNVYSLWRQTVVGQVTEALEMNLIFELAGSLRNQRVLDVGTGDGSYAWEASARGAWAVGIDHDGLMVHAAQSRFPTKDRDIAFVCASSDAIPFPDASFDVILAVTVLCLLHDPRVAVSEMDRVLAPGGRLVIGELAKWSLWAAGRRIRGWLGHATWRHARFWSRRDLSDLVQSAGFHVEAVRGAIHYPPLAVAAQTLAPADRLLGRLNAPAAFLAIAGAKHKCSP